MLIVQQKRHFRAFSGKLQRSERFYGQHVGGSMETVVVTALILGAMVYLYTRTKIKELAGHIDHAQKRIKSTHDNQAQHEMDMGHVQAWATTVVTLRQANLVGRIIVWAAIALFLAVRAYQYAVAYHWFG